MEAIIELTNFCIVLGIVMYSKTEVSHLNVMDESKGLFQYTMYA